MWLSTPRDVKGVLVVSHIKTPIWLKLAATQEATVMLSQSITFFCLCKLDKLRAEYNSAQLNLTCAPPGDIRETQWGWDCIQLLTVSLEKDLSFEDREWLVRTCSFGCDKPLVHLSLGRESVVINDCDCTMAGHLTCALEPSVAEVFNSY